MPVFSGHPDAVISPGRQFVIVKVLILFGQNKEVKKYKHIMADARRPTQPPLHLKYNKTKHQQDEAHSSTNPRPFPRRLRSSQRPSRLPGKERKPSQDHPSLLLQPGSSSAFQLRQSRRHELGQALAHLHRR